MSTRKHVQMITMICNQTSFFRYDICGISLILLTCCEGWNILAKGKAANATRLLVVYICRLVTVFLYPVIIFYVRGNIIIVIQRLFIS